MARFRLPHFRSTVLSTAALALSFLISQPERVIAQESSLPIEQPHVVSDSSNYKSLSDWFSKGHFGGLWRTQAMGTFHQAPLTDNWASGTAFRLHYSTASYKGWQVNVVGQFGYALASSDLTGVDQLTGQRARFELHMFDIEDPTNRKDFDRLENLTLSKNFKNARIEIGRYSFDSPFVNGQDTRLKANAFSGATAYTKLGKKLNHKLSAAWVHGISPRGTIKWFNIDQSLGLLDNGLRPDRADADYHHNVRSGAMFIAGWQYDKKDQSAEFWQYYTLNLFTHSYGRFTKDIGEAKQWNVGVEGLWQQKVGNGGNALEENRYYFNNSPALLLGGRVRHERSKMGYEIATLSSIGEGTYLFPREWGRERFFTSVPRARVEGLGKFTEVSMQFDSKLRKNILMLMTLAYLNVPDVSEALHNKYSLVDHYLINGEVRVDGHNKMENTSFRFIAAAHYPAAGSFSANDLYYKAEFVHLSLQMDVYF